MYYELNSEPAHHPSQELGRHRVWPGHFTFGIQYYYYYSVLFSHPTLCNFQDVLKIIINVPVLRFLGRFSYVYINKSLIAGNEISPEVERQQSMSRVDRTAQHLIGISNQEACGGFEKASSAQV